MSLFSQMCSLSQVISNWLLTDSKMVTSVIWLLFKGVIRKESFDDFDGVIPITLQCGHLHQNRHQIYKDPILSGKVFSNPGQRWSGGNWTYCLDLVEEPEEGFRLRGCATWFQSPELDPFTIRCSHCSTQFRKPNHRFWGKKFSLCGVFSFSRVLMIKKTAIAAATLAHFA